MGGKGHAGINLSNLQLRIDYCGKCIGTASGRVYYNSWSVLLPVSNGAQGGQG